MRPTRRGCARRGMTRARSPFLARVLWMRSARVRVPRRPQIRLGQPVASHALDPRQAKTHPFGGASLLVIEADQRGLARSHAMWYLRHGEFRPPPSALSVSSRGVLLRPSPSSARTLPSRSGHRAPQTLRGRTRSSARGARSPGEHVGC